MLHDMAQRYMIILSCWDHSWGLKRKAIPHFKRFLLHEWMDESRNINCKNEQSISSWETNNGPYGILGAPHARFWVKMISVWSQNHHDINTAVQCLCSDCLLSLAQSCFVCSRVKVWHCIGVDPQHLLSWSLPLWWVILLLFIESWTSLQLQRLSWWASWRRWCPLCPRVEARVRVRTVQMSWNASDRTSRVWDSWSIKRLLF